MTTQKIVNLPFSISLDFPNTLPQNIFQNIVNNTTLNVHNPTILQNGDLVCKFIAPGVKPGSLFHAKEISITPPKNSKKKPVFFSSATSPILGHDTLDPLTPSFNIIKTLIALLTPQNAPISPFCGARIRILLPQNANLKALVKITQLTYNWENLFFSAFNTSKERTAKIAKPISDKILEKILSSPKNGLPLTKGAFQAKFSDKPFGISWIEFGYFQNRANFPEIKAYTLFSLALVKYALNSKNMPKQNKRSCISSHTKYDFRWFLNLIGLKGDANANARYHLLKNLHGDPAYRNTFRPKYTNSPENSKLVA
jgi:hypothetical protein